MHIFDVQSSNRKVNQAYAIAEKILVSREFIERLGQVKKFTYTQATPEQVVKDFENAIKDILTEKSPRVRVKEYTYPSRNVVGTTGLDKDPEAIFINMTNINFFDLMTYIGNGPHEFGHKPMGYGHGSNYTQDTWKGRAMCKFYGDFEDKELSVPNVLENLVKQIAKEKHLMTNLFAVNSELGA